LHSRCAVAADRSRKILERADQERKSRANTTRA
jgi:hypothetical protein